MMKTINGYTIQALAQLNLYTTKVYMVLILCMVVGMLPTVAMAAESYTVTVVGGTVEDYYTGADRGDTVTAAEGDYISIEAQDPSEGQLFSHWEYTDNIPELYYDDDHEHNVFTMPAGDVTLTAVYETGCIVTVDPGEGEIMLDSGYWVEPVSTKRNGEIIWLDYGKYLAPPDGQRFSHWLVAGETYFPEAEFTVTKDITITAQYKDITYSTLTVVNGYAETEDGQSGATFENLPYGTRFFATADLDGDTGRPSDTEYETFTMWDIEGDIELNDCRLDSIELMGSMGDTDLTLTAYFGEIAPDYYQVTGSDEMNFDYHQHEIQGSLYYKVGETVYFSCYPPEGQRVDHWETTGIASSDIHADGEELYSFEMPAEAVTLTPCFVTGDDHGGDATIASVTLVDRGYEAGNLDVEVDEIVFHNAGGIEISSYQYSYDIVSAVMVDDTVGENKTVTVTLKNWDCSMYDLPDPTATATVTIFGENNLESVTMEDYTYGDAPTTPVVTFAGGTPNGGEMTFIYGNYKSETPPTTVGTHTVFATSAASGAILEKTVEGEFEILPRPIVVSGATVVERDYLPDDKSVDITSVTFADKDGNPVVIEERNYYASGEMADDSAGDNKAVTVTVWIRAGNNILTEDTYQTTVRILDVDYAYEENDDGTLTLTQYYGNEENIIVPETINGKTVTGIGKRLFGYSDTIKTITLPTTVTTIADGAMSGCDLLTTVEGTDNVVEIGNNAFDSCSKLTTLGDFSKLATIGDYAFDECTSLTTLGDLSELVTIGVSAFSECSVLTTMGNLGKLTTIGRYAFDSCSALTTLGDLGELVTIGERAFNRCSRLANIGSLSKLSTIDDYAFDGCVSLTTLGDMSKLTTIGVGAFSDCKALATLGDLGELTTIDSYAFMGCSSLTTLGDLSKLTTINGYAFKNCEGITNLGDLSELKTIGRNAFYGCSGLTTIENSNKLTYIGDFAFDGCTSLVALGDLSELTFLGTTFFECHSLTTLGGEMSKLTYIGPSAFSNFDSLEKFRVPDGVNRLYHYTFEGCSNLRKLYIPDTVISFPVDGALEGYNHPDYAIYTVPGSAAEAYALRSGIPVYYGGFDLGDINLGFTGGSYQGATLKLYENDTLIQEHNISLTVGEMSLSGLDPDGTFRVELYNGIGSLIGQQENIQLVEERAEVTLTLPAPKTVALTVTAGGSDITDEVSVTWMDNDTTLSTDATLKGMLSGDSVQYQISLDEELSLAYETPAEGSYTIIDGENNVTVALISRQSVTVNGTVTCDGNAVPGVAVALTQQLGRHTIQEAVVTDSMGHFTLTVYKAPGSVEISGNGYISQIITHNSDLTQKNLSTVTLEAVTWGIISLDATQRRAVADGKTAVPTQLLSGTDLQFNIYNVTQNQAVTNWVAQYPDIVLLESVGDGDTLRITATDTTGRLQTASTTVVMTGNGAKGTLSLVEAGFISVSTRQNQNAESVLMLFDGNGDRVAQYSYLRAGIQTGGLPDGTYTLISMAKHLHYNAVQTLSEFEALDLALSSFVRQTTQVVSGEISEVLILSIPLLVDNSANHLDTVQSRMAPNKSEITLGGAVNLTTDIVFQEAYAQDMSDVSIELTLSDGLNFMPGSVYLDGEVQPVAALNGKIAVDLGDGTAKKLHMTLSPNSEGVHPITAMVRYTYNGQQYSSHLPLVELTAQNMTVHFSEVVSEKRVVLSGTAIPNSLLKVYVDCKYTKQLRVPPTGEWWTEVKLPGNYQTSAQYVIHLEGNTPGGTTGEEQKFSTQPQIVKFQDGYPQVERVTMHADTQRVVYDYIYPGRSSNYYYSDDLEEVTFTIEFANAEEEMKGDPDWVYDVKLMVSTLSGENRFLDATYQGNGKWVATTDMTGDRVRTVGVDFETTAPMKVDIDYLEKKSEELSALGEAISKEIIAESTINPDAEYMFITEKVQESPTRTRYDMYWFEDVDKTAPLGTHLVEELDYVEYATADLEAMGFVLTPHRESDAFYVCVERDDPDELRMLLVDKELGKAYRSVQLYRWVAEETPRPAMVRAMWSESDADRNIGFLAFAKIGEEITQHLPGPASDMVGNALGALKAWVDTDSQMELIERLENDLYKNEQKRRTNFNSSECPSEDAEAIRLKLEAKAMEIDMFRDKAMQMFLDEYYNEQKLLEYGIDIALTAGAVVGDAFEAAWGYTKDAKTVYDSVTKGTLDEKLKALAQEIDSRVAKAYQDAYEECKEEKDDDDDDEPKYDYDFTKEDEEDPFDFTRPGNYPWPILDPSGYVYEAVPSNRIEGVTATVYTEETWEDAFGDEQSEIVQWKATPFGQENPLTTNDEGRYAWDVPAGQWQVKYEKDGYETTYSSWLTVPPPQTEVNLSIISLEAPTVERISIYTDCVEIVFSKYMDLSTLNGENITVIVGGEPVDGYIELIDAEKNPILNRSFASTIRFVPTNPDFDPADENSAQTLVWEHGTDVTVTLSDKLKSYAAVRVDDAYSETKAVTIEPKTITAPGQVTMIEGESKEITVDFGANNSAVGKTLNISESNLFTVPTSAIVDRTGKAHFTATSILPGSETLTISLAETTLTADIMIVAKAKDAIAEKEPLAGTVTITGNSKVGSTLTANYVGGPDAEHYTIYWLRNGAFCPVCKGTTWLLTENQVGQSITVEVRAKGDAYTGSLFSTNSVTVQATGGGNTGGDSYTPAEKDTHEELATWNNPFTDVVDDAWYINGVKYVHMNGLMDGISVTTFAPYDGTTRSMVWTVLARMADTNLTGGATWYSKAQEWAMNEDVSDGTNPDNLITREQFVTMLWRNEGRPVIADYEGLGKFADIDELTDYAQFAMAWAHAEGIIAGKSDDILDPKGDMTRVEMAVILQRYLTTD